MCDHDEENTWLGQRWTVALRKRLRMVGGLVMIITRDCEVDLASECL